MYLLALLFLNFWQHLVFNTGKRYYNVLPHILSQLFIAIPLKGIRTADCISQQCCCSFIHSYVYTKQCRLRCGKM